MRRCSFDTKWVAAVVMACFPAFAAPTVHVTPTLDGPSFTQRLRAELESAGFEWKADANADLLVTINRTSDQCVVQLEDRLTQKSTTRSFSFDTSDETATESQLALGIVELAHASLLELERKRAPKASSTRPVRLTLGFQASAGSLFGTGIWPLIHFSAALAPLHESFRFFVEAQAALTASQLTSSLGTAFLRLAGVELGARGSLGSNVRAFLEGSVGITTWWGFGQPSVEGATGRSDAAVVGLGKLRAGVQVPLVAGVAIVVRAGVGLTFPQLNVRIEEGPQAFSPMWLEGSGGLEWTW
jgi:hypothetical protein